MSHQSRYNPESNIQPPKCPYCSTPLPQVDCYQWTRQAASGLMMIFAINCPNAECKKLLGTQIALIPHAEEHAIVGPH
jgi:hypothetical protein